MGNTFINGGIVGSRFSYLTPARATLEDIVLCEILDYAAF